MKAYKDIQKNLKNITKMGKELGELKSSIPSLLDEVVKNTPESGKEKINKFVKESNDLLSKAENSSDFADMQNLTNEFIKKWQKQ